MGRCHKWLPHPLPACLPACLPAHSLLRGGCWAAAKSPPPCLCGCGCALQVVREVLPSGVALRTNIDATLTGNVARFFNHRCACAPPAAAAAAAGLPHFERWRSKKRTSQASCCRTQARMHAAAARPDAANGHPLYEGQHSCTCQN